jgi:hypothetical protein
MLHWNLFDPRIPPYSQGRKRQMDVTIFIGNGFDLNVGLKTNFPSFLEYYLRERAFDPVIASHKRRIRTEMHRRIQNWGDMEIALGMYAANFEQSEKGEQEFRNLHKDIIGHLSMFIHTEQNKVTICDDLRHGICGCLLEAFQCPYNGLPATNRNIVNDEWIKQIHKEQAIRFHFISYNYSNVFDRCLDILPKTKTIPAEAGRQAAIAYEFSEVVHVHGNYSEGLVLGVDHRKQLHNVYFHNDTMDCTLIKPDVIESNHSGKGELARSALRQSQFAIVYGMSLGLSDDSWWRHIGNWLTQDWNRHLIVYYTDFQCKKIWPDGNHIAEKAVHDAFRRAMGEAAFQLVFYRIHVALNYPLFPLRLVCKQ